MLGQPSNKRNPLFATLSLCRFFSEFWLHDIHFVYIIYDINSYYLHISMFKVKLSPKCNIGFFVIEYESNLNVKAKFHVVSSLLSV